MNTKRMISDINATIEELMTEKTSLLDRVKAIEDNITAYRMAIESLELTVTQAKAVVEQKPEPKQEDGVKHYKKTTQIEYAGRTQKASLWAKEFGMNPDMLIARLNSGWTVEDAITKPKAQGKPIRKRHPRKVFAYDPHGNIIRQYIGVADAAKDLKLAKNVVEKMLTDISIADQIASRNFYLAYAS